MSKKISDNELLKNLKNVYEEYGYISKKTINEFGGYGDHLYYRRFKTLDKAMQIIGVDIELNNKLKNKEAFKNIKKKHSDEGLLDILRNYNNTIGLPTQRDFVGSNGLPSYTTYFTRFGSFQNALIKAGIEIPQEKQWLYEREEYTKEYLLEQLKIQTEIKLKNSLYLLTFEEINNIKDMPSESAYYTNFKTLTKAYELIGYDKNYNKIALENDMKNKYIEIKNILGRPPHSRDLEKFSRESNIYYGCTTYINHFKSINNLHKIMGDEDYSTIVNMSEQEALFRLKRLYNELGIVPSQNDLKICSYTPNAPVYRRLFGSFPNSIKKIGLKPRGLAPLFTPNGNKALSGYEYKFLLMLEKYNIKFSKEDFYSDYMDFDKKYRFDFILYVDNEKYFVEIFGITGSDKYNKKIDEKISLCEKNNLKLIDFYGDDIVSKNTDEIYTMLSKRINNINK